MKKFISYLTAAALTVMLLMNTASALGSETIVASGKCGENVTWTVDSEGVLKISGTGRMYDYEMSPPWNDSNIMEVSNTAVLKAVIEDGVTYIGQWALSGCVFIKSLSIPKSVTEINRYALLAGYFFTHIDVADENPVFTAIDGVLFTKDMSEILCCPSAAVGEYSIPDGVKEISENAFGLCAAVTKVVIPESVTVIEEDAFISCSSLSEIVIPKSVKSIGDSAFMGCEALTDVHYGGTENEWNIIDIGKFSNDFLKNANIHFQGEASEPYCRGDINGDRYVNTKDSNILKRIMVGSFKTNDKEFAAADLNGDKRINTKDAYLLKKIIIK